MNDHNYLLAVSRWQQIKANGPTTILYSDGTLFQGNILDLMKSAPISQEKIFKFIHCSREEMGCLWVSILNKPLLAFPQDRSNYSLNFND